MSDTPITVTFATLSAGQPLLDHMRSVQTVMSSESLGERYKVLCHVSAASGPYLDMGRNQLVETLLNDPDTRDSDWFVMLDDDIVFTPENARDLLDHATSTPTPTLLASGMYACVDPNFGHSICAYNLTPYDPDVHPEAIAPHRLEDGRFFCPIPIDAAPTTSVPIDAFGAGFMAVHRDLLHRMGAAYKNPQRWFAELVLTGFNPSDDPDAEPVGMWIGEDLIFCLRAANFTQPYLVPVGVEHLKRQKLIVPAPTREYPG